MMFKYVEEIFGRQVESFHLRHDHLPGLAPVVISILDAHKKVDYIILKLILPLS
jgi:hypothetical protein